MFNMPGGPEVVVIFVVALVVLGPQQLPKAMRTLGSVMAEVRKVSNSFQSEMRNAMDVVDIRPTEKPQSGSMAAVTPTSTSPSESASASTDADTSTIDEVVVRNDAPAAPEEQAQVTAADAAPAVDPADRAAG